MARLGVFFLDAAVSMDRRHDDRTPRRRSRAVTLVGIAGFGSADQSHHDGCLGWSSPNVSTNVRERIIREVIFPQAW